MFLAACAKVCVLKKIPKPASNEDSEECKEQVFEYKIMIKKALLKDIITDPNFNYTLNQRIPLKPQAKLDLPRH